MVPCDHRPHKTYSLEIPTHIRQDPINDHRTGTRMMPLPGRLTQRLPTQPRRPNRRGESVILALKSRCRLSDIVKATQQSQKRPPPTARTTIKPVPYRRCEIVIPQALTHRRRIKQMLE
ncbi:hypothetical protein Sar04_48060 [Salinispora arenicola]|uniref:Uncharacterized protein n=1 Tax=Salinispora arenicola TaxID=168697 RepID=A0ABQ4JYS9_SALAC|nr:hypothetical protein Sar04_48060 [Salinispora arenicola]